jgi:hypothetical protein
VNSNHFSINGIGDKHKAGKGSIDHKQAAKFIGIFVGLSKFFQGFFGD